MKITTTTVPVVTERVIKETEQQKRFVLELTPEEARVLKRLANCNLSLPTIMEAPPHQRNMLGVCQFLTDVYHALEAQAVSA